MTANLVPKGFGAAEPRQVFCNRLILLLLLLAVPTLSTLAKTHWYLPAGNAAHHLTAAVKMKVAHPVKLAHRPATLEPQPLLLTAKVVPPRTEMELLHNFQFEIFPLATAHHLDFQHRAPPAALSL